MRCDQAQELITARLDNELSADEHSAIEAHLHTCERCQRALTAESRLKQQLKLARQEVTAPAALRHEIESEIASQRPVLAVKTEGGFASWFSLRSWRPAFALVTLFIAIAAIFYAKSPQQDVGMIAIETHRDLLSGKTALVRYDDASRLRQELSRAVRDRFAPIALDLSMMRLYPVSGFVQKIGGREVLVTVYQGAGPAITCLTLLGSKSDAPERAQHFYDSDMKLNVYLFSQDGINAVLHSEGDIICILVSKMSPADILALLRGKSAHA